MSNNFNYTETLLDNLVESNVFIILADDLSC